MRYKLMVFFLAAAFLFTAGFSAPDYLPVDIKSDSCLLLDAGTGQMLITKNADAPYPIAGAAKMMSALLIMEAFDSGRISKTEKIVVSKTAASIGGTRAYLDSGNEYTAEELFKAVCCASANDATIALAEKAFGSEKEFVAAMNRRAEELGCKDTVFDNCTGHLSTTTSTARDMSRIALALCEHKEVFQYTAMFNYALTHPSGRITELVNYNRLVRYLDGCDGLFTGSEGTKSYAGVFTVKKNDMRLICVVLNAADSDERFNTARSLFEYGFANFVSKTVIRKGEVLYKQAEVIHGRPSKVDLVSMENVRLVLQYGEEKQINKELIVELPLQAPIQQGDIVGETVIFLSGERIATCPVTVNLSSTKPKITEIMLLIIRSMVRG